MYAVTSRTSLFRHKDTVDTTLLESASMSVMSMVSRRRSRQRLALTAIMAKTTTVSAAIQAVLATDDADVGDTGASPDTCRPVNEMTPLSRLSAQL